MTQDLEPDETGYSIEIVHNLDSLLTDITEMALSLQLKAVENKD